MIQTLTAYRADDTFDVGSLPGRSWSGEYFLNAQSADLIREVVSVDSIAIAQQVARRGVPRKGFAKLLGRPFRRGVSGDIEMNDPPSVMSQNQKDV